MINTIKSFAFRFGLPLLGFVLIYVIGEVFQRIFSFDFNPALLAIALLIATAWYIGRLPGLFVALMFEATLVYFSPAPYTAKSAFSTVNRLALFASLVLFASSRRDAERRLREKRELLQVTLKSIGDAVIATDLEGKVSFINPVAEALAGWKSEEATGKPLEEIFRIVNEETHQTAENPFTAVVREGAIVGLANHTLLIAKDGTEIPIEDSGAPIKDAKGKIVGVIIVFHDVSEGRQAEREREKLLTSEQAARREAEIAARLKDEFLATVSHELRTPLSAILGWAVMLKNNRLEEKDRQKALNVIERNARAQGEIVGDLLDISQIVTKKIKIERHFIEISPILKTTVDSLHTAAEAKSIKLTALIDKGKFFVIGDAERLYQIIRNVISNAVKFTPERGTVEIHAARNETYFEMTVWDSGIGIDADFLPYVFDRFRQGDASATRDHGGLGLGLSIARDLARLHGGEISAESKGVGKGAVFTVRLPLAANQSNVNFKDN